MSKGCELMEDCADPEAMHVHVHAARIRNTSNCERKELAIDREWTGDMGLENPAVTAASGPTGLGSARAAVTLRQDTISKFVIIQRQAVSAMSRLRCNCNDWLCLWRHVHAYVNVRGAHCS
jgi:hypothetical protein